MTSSLLGFLFQQRLNLSRIFSWSDHLRGVGSAIGTPKTNMLRAPYAAFHYVLVSWYFQHIHAALAIAAQTSAGIPAFFCIVRDQGRIRTCSKLWCALYGVLTLRVFSALPLPALQATRLPVSPPDHLPVFPGCQAVLRTA